MGGTNNQNPQNNNQQRSGNALVTVTLFPPIYESDKVVNRHSKGFPFFKKGDDSKYGKFATVVLKEEPPELLRPRLSNETPLSNTIPFHQFLEIYFQERTAWEFPSQNQR
jgi:hypothetical protein